MRIGSAGLMAMLWALTSNIATASPLAEEGKPPAAMPIMRRQSGTAPTPTPTTEVTNTGTTPTSTPPAEEATTTVTVTTTVAGNGNGAVTVGTTVLRTITTTIVVTTTVFETTTVTSNDVATATLTIYATSTVLAKRSLNFLPVVAAPVDAPAALVTPAADPRKRFVEKRALVTVVVTVTGNAGAGSTVFSTKTNTVIQTTTSNLIHTSTITSVQYNNAETTVTVTSTLIVTSTAIETSAPTTVENGPTTGNFGTATLTGDGSSSTGGSSSSSGSGELSTGAKAGIGAAVGVVALAAIIGFGWWFYKRRKANRPSAADLADMRAYDPNGPSLNNGMTEADYGRGAAAAAVPTHRREPPPRRKSGQLSPPTGSVSPMSNNNVSPAGEYGHPYGRPAANELGDTRVMPPEMGGDEVVEMGDGQPRPPPQRVPQRPAFQPGPVSDVYEMPDQRYR